MRKKDFKTENSYDILNILSGALNLAEDFSRKLQRLKFSVFFYKISPELCSFGDL